jgi:hypothetical protein
VFESDHAAKPHELRVTAVGIIGSVSEKQLKKVLTLSTEIVYHVARFQNRERTFAR